MFPKGPFMFWKIVPFFAFRSAVAMSDEKKLSVGDILDSVMRLAPMLEIDARFAILTSGLVSVVKDCLASELNTSFLALVGDSPST
jgi:hypothetical protein